MRFGALLAVLFVALSMLSLSVSSQLVSDFDGHRYEVYSTSDDHFRNYAAAVTFAQTARFKGVEPHLVTIRSAAEQSFFTLSGLSISIFLASHLGITDCFIGAFDYGNCLFG